MNLLENYSRRELVENCKTYLKNTIEEIPIEVAIL